MNYILAAILVGTLYAALQKRAREATTWTHVGAGPRATAEAAWAKYLRGRYPEVVLPDAAWDKFGTNEIFGNGFKTDKGSRLIQGYLVAGEKCLLVRMTGKNSEPMRKLAAMLASTKPVGHETADSGDPANDRSHPTAPSPRSRT